MYKGCILRDNRVVIPTTLRSKILNSLDTGHPGIVRMKALSRSYVWWPRIGNKIEKFIKNCIPCQSFHKSDPIDKESKWPISTTPWSRIHLDFAGPFSGKIFLIITDSYSKWLHVQIVPNTSSSATISCLRNLFVTHGLPDTIVSDNGTGFTSEFFQNFCRANNISHKLSAPFHPSSNGRAERMVQSTKLFLKKISIGKVMTNSDWDIVLSQFLFSQHVTPLSSGEGSPGELLMKRKLRTTLNFFRNSLPEVHEVHATRREFKVGDSVFLRNYSRGPDWIPGKIIKRRGNVMYDIQLNDNRLVSRHIDQLRINECTKFPFPSEDLPSRSNPGIDNPCLPDESTIVPDYSNPSSEVQNSQASYDNVESDIHNDSRSIQNSDNIESGILNDSCLVPNSYNDESEIHNDSLLIPNSESNSVLGTNDEQNFNEEMQVDDPMISSKSPRPPPRSRRRNVRIFNNEFIT